MANGAKIITTARELEAAQERAVTLLREVVSPENFISIDFDSGLHEGYEIDMELANRIKATLATLGMIQQARKDGGNGSELA